ncbi:nuclear transport factor 2 family protein, partial [Phenylobacterium sp.]|uniref:nuclear transport factor 2 family protein n=1 Tax=Phenylobacterium sp. TaxID=1871053 RepID=UPI002811ED76
MISALLAAALLATATPLDPADVKAVEAVAYDYVDGQLEGDPRRVARSLHPDLAKRAVETNPDEVFALRR